MNVLLSKRAVLVTGKGGVGRTSVTAALAITAQRAGKRVLVTEMADGGEDYSALAQLFGARQLPRVAAEIAPGILGAQLLPEVGAELFLASVLRVGAIAKRAMSFEPLRRLFTAGPSLREMGVFFHLLTYLRAEKSPGVPLHEIILIDMPATGHTLALTGLPEVILRLVSHGPVADALRDGQRYLNDPKLSSAYIVTLPETLPISEALELIEGLKRTSMHCGGIFVNRMPVDTFSSEEKDALTPYLSAHALFGAEGFRRVIDARKAVDRLHSATQVPVAELPELIDTGPELLAKLTPAVAQARFGAKS